MRGTLPICNLTPVYKARSLEEAFSHAPTLQEWDLSGHGLDALPDTVPPFPQLRQLDLSRNKLKHLPSWITELPLLERLILRNNELSLLPTALARLPHLRRLVLDGNPLPGFTSLPPSLRELSANDCSIESFPTIITQCPELESLARNGLRTVPADHVLPSTLQLLDLSGNHLQRFPAHLLSAAALSYLNVTGNPFLENLGGTAFAELLAKFFTDAHKRELPLPARACQLDILLEDHLAAARHPTDLLLDSLDAAFRPLQAKALKVLAKVLPNPLVQLPPSKVVLAGTFSEAKLSEVKGELALAGFLPLPRLQDASTLLIVGQNPGRLLAQARALQCPIAVEGHLLSWIIQKKGAFLQAAAETGNPMLENQLRLLRSTDTANIEMGLMLMTGGGVPDIAMPELLALRLFQPEQNIREQAANLWLPLAPHPLRDLVARTWKAAQLQDGFINYHLILEKLVPYSPTQAESLIAAAMAHHRIGLQWIHQLPTSAQVTLYLTVTKNGNLRLDRLGLQSIPEGIWQMPELRALNLSRNQLTKLPAQIDRLPHLTLLDLASNMLPELPDSLSTLTQLATLDLAANRLPTFPEACTTLPQLEALRLSHNPLKQLPPTLSRLPRLEYLGLRDTSVAVLKDLHFPDLFALDLGECGLEQIPEPVFDLRRLESLHLDHNPILHLPDALAQLPRLRYLDLSYIQATRLPEAFVTCPRLERLYLLRDDSMDWHQVADILRQIPSLRHVYFKRHKIVATMERHLEKTIRQAKLDFVL